MARLVDPAPAVGPEVPMALDGAGGAGGADGAAGADGADGAASAAGAGGADGAVDVDAGHFPGSELTQEEIDAKIMQIADDFRVATDLETLWSLREAEDALAAEQAARQLGHAMELPEVEVLTPRTAAAESMRLQRQREAWPSLAAAKNQPPKRRRSATPAAREMATGAEPDAGAGGAAAADSADGAVDVDAGHDSVQQQLAARRSSVGMTVCAKLVDAIGMAESDAPSAPGMRAVRFGDGSTPGSNPPQPAGGAGAGSSNDPPAGQVEQIPTKAMPRLLPAGVTVQP